MSLMSSCAGRGFQRRKNELPYQVHEIDPASDGAADGGAGVCVKVLLAEERCGHREGPNLGHMYNHLLTVAGSEKFRSITKA
jgi:hypothetical protein